jgi:uncharacterized membrane protein YeaQ/YmgE (transglycosylase-associated protein family)
VDDLVVWLVVGLVAGSVAGYLVPGRTPGGVVGTLAVGLLGGLVGGWVLERLGVGRNLSWLGSLAVAVVGAVVILAVLRRVQAS